MKSLILILSLLSAPAFAKPVTFAWDASPSGENVAGYMLYYWTPNTTATKKDCGNVTTCSVDIEVAKAYSFAVTAYNTAGLESDFSNICVYFEMYGTPLEVVSVGPNKLAKLSWLQAPPAKGYQLVYGTGSGTNVTWVSTNNIAGYTNNVAQVQLIQGTNFFRVRPVFQSTAAGFPDYTSGFTATREIAPPSRPQLRLVLPPEQILQEAP